MSAMPDGRFTVKSAFDLQQSPLPDGDTGNWRWIWKIPYLERIRSFIRQLSHDRLLTNLSHFHRHISTTADCPRCPGSQESLSHVFRECPIASGTWEKLGIRSQWFFNQPFEAWIRSNATARPSADHTMIPWFLIFLGTLWFLWKARNLWIFEQKSSTTTEISRRALAHAREAAGTLRTESITRQRRQIWVHWTPPP